MTSEPGSGGRPAGEVFDLSLRPRPGGQLRHWARVAGAFASQMALGVVPSPAVHDVVVTRRADGAEVMRVPTDDPLTEGDLLAHIRGQLAELDEEAFLAAWGSSPES